MTSNRKRGGQPNNQNAVTHGRYSAATRAQRRAEMEARQAHSQEWQSKIPPFPWHVVDELKRLRREKDEKDAKDEIDAGKAGGTSKCF